MPNAAVCYVHLADNEYSHSTRLADGTWITDRDGKRIDNMWDAAAEVFAAHPDVENLVVEVSEHGGWRLAYLRDKTIVGTANDRAILSEPARRFHEVINSGQVEWTYLPEVWRGREVEVA